MSTQARYDSLSYLLDALLGPLVTPIAFLESGFAAGILGDQREPILSMLILLVAWCVVLAAMRRLCAIVRDSLMIFMARVRSLFFRWRTWLACRDSMMDGARSNFSALDDAVNEIDDVDLQILSSATTRPAGSSVSAMTLAARLSRQIGSIEASLERLTNHHLLEREAEAFDEQADYRVTPTGAQLLEMLQQKRG